MAVKKPGPDHERLGAFVGRWRKEGQAIESPFGPAAPVTAVESFEWLAGRYFLVHRLDGRLGDTEMACIEVMGYDAARERYFARSFYNDGNSTEWRGHVSRGKWTFTGDWKLGRRRFKVRHTLVPDKTGNTMMGTWRYSERGSRWRTFWVTRLTRMR